MLDLRPYFADLPDPASRGAQLAGKWSFEDWMRTQGHSDQSITETDQIVDRWLIEHGLIPPPPV